MSGSSSGAQIRIKAVAPYAMYIHCNTHCLNLCLVDCVKVVYSASEFFSIVQNLYTFISTSKCHVIFMQQQTALYPGKQHRQLQRLSDTRWACRQSAISAICYRFDAIIGTLVEVVNGNDGAKAAEANGILLQVKSFKFILCLVIFDRVLSCSKGLSDALQSTHLDLGKAADLVTSTIQTLEQFRTDDEWEKVLTYSRSVADVHGVSPCESSTRPSRNPRPPRRFESDIITGTTGCRVESTLDGYKVDLYFSVLDAFLSELKRRFSDKNRDIMRSLQACCPSSDSFFVIDHLKPMIHMYDLDLDMISSEIKVARRTLTGKQLEDISGVIIELAPLKVAFPTLLQLLRIALTIPVSSAKCERTFSTLKRIKTYIRSSMSEDQLNDTAILAIEHDITSSLNLDNIVTEFSKVNRRIAL